MIHCPRVVLVRRDVRTWQKLSQRKVGVVERAGKMGPPPARPARGACAWSQRAWGRARVTDEIASVYAGSHGTFSRSLATSARAWRRNAVTCKPASERAGYHQTRPLAGGFERNR